MIPRIRVARRMVSRAMLVLLIAPAPAGLAATGPALQLMAADQSQPLDLSLEQLEAMPQVTIKTENEFSDGLVTYRGPLVRDVLAQAGLDKLETVRFVAANDYYVDIPTRDFSDFDAILAMEANGEKLSRREKGPLWLMYPISDHAALKDPIYLRRLIWQVVRIEAL